MEKLKGNKEFFVSREELIKDFDFMYETLRTYYPFFDINNQVNNIDWLGNREIYREKILQCKTDKDFYNIINFEVLSELNNGHTHLLPTEMALGMYIYYNNLEKPNWREILANAFQQPNALLRYEITDENINKCLESQDNNIPEETRKSNVTLGDIIPEKVAYIEIKEMIEPNLNIKSFKQESEIIKRYLKKIKDYPILIIDIRGNEGGNSYYWSDFLMPLIVNKSYSQKTYSFIKEGELLSEVISHYEYKRYTDEIKSKLDFPQVTFNMIKDFSYYLPEITKVVPDKDSVNFKGEIYLLVDKYVFSSSEMLASFAKESNMATVVGERTSGDGLGSDPMLIDLPNSGYVLRFPKEMGITEKGIINELDQTTPDIVISNPEKKIKFDCYGKSKINDDKAIIYILEL